MKVLLTKLGINSWESFWAFVKQFLKFGIVGLSNTFISLAVYYLFLWIDPKLYMVGNIVGWVVSVANSFFWNRRFVFKDTTTPLPKALLKSYVSYGGTFLLSTALLALQVEVIGVPETLAPLINLLVTIPLNFLINKFWTFRQSAGKRP